MLGYAAFICNLHRNLRLDGAVDAQLNNAVALLLNSLFGSLLDGAVGLQLDGAMDGFICGFSLGHFSKTGSGEVAESDTLPDDLLG